MYLGNEFKAKSIGQSLNLGSEFYLDIISDFKIQAHWQNSV